MVWVSVWCYPSRSASFLVITLSLTLVKENKTQTSHTSTMFTCSRWLTLSKNRVNEYYIRRARKQTTKEWFMKMRWKRKRITRIMWGRVRRTPEIDSSRLRVCLVGTLLQHQTRWATRHCYYHRGGMKRDMLNLNTNIFSKQCLVFLDSLYLSSSTNDNMQLILIYNISTLFIMQQSLY